MSLVPSLLQAIVHVEGEALVMHAGDRPYIVAPPGQIELSRSALEPNALIGIVAQLLPADVQRVLDESGSVQYDLPPQADFPGEYFTVVVARGGNDVWAEIRRRRLNRESIAEQTAPVEPAALEPPVRDIRVTGLEEVDERIQELREAARQAELVLATLREAAQTKTKEEPLDSLNSFGELLVKSKLNTLTERLRALHGKVDALATRFDKLESELSRLALRLPPVDP